MKPISLFWRNKTIPRQEEKDSHWKVERSYHRIVNPTYLIFGQGG